MDYKTPQTMKNIYIILFTILATLLFSCSEGFLDKKPHDAVASSQAITTMNDAEVALNGVYSGLKAGSAYGRLLTVLPDVMTDAALASVGYTNQLGEMYKYNYVPGTGEVSNIWARGYNTIARANNIINSIDGIEGEQSEKDNLKGQALFARAIAHFDMVRLYAKAYDPANATSTMGIPYIKETKLGSPERDNVDLVYTEIINDLNQAKTLIQDAGSPAPESYDYFTKASCDALLARVYLTMQDYDDAVEYAENVIQDYSFSLIDDQAEYASMWLNDEGSEIIWRVKFTPTDIGGSPGYNYYNDAQGPPSPDYQPAEWILNLYDQANDFRYEVYFHEDALTNDGWTATLVDKYPTNPDFTDNGANMPKVFRLPEQYLIAAEAHAELDNDGLAMGYLNDLRATRIAGYTDESLTGNALKDAIWDERIKELAYEGHYWFDLKRRGMGFTRTPQANTFTANDLSVPSDNFRWLWPIPQDEINANENMVQNNGYN